MTATTPRHIVAIDPGMSCPGYAVLAIPAPHGPRDGTIVEAGVFELPDSDRAPLADRLGTLYADAHGVIERFGSELAAVVIEFPQTVTRGKRGLRSASTLPTYGMAVGVAYCAALAHESEMLTPSATEWTRGLPPTHRDPDKTQRVDLASRLYRLQDWPEAKAKRAAIADAVLLARWALNEFNARKWGW
jgi:Holliday junction resolvasome RuvABC endonuclease subunit